MLILTGAVGAGQERSDDEVLLNVVVSLSGGDGSSVSLYLVACSWDGTALNEAKQINRMITLWGTSHKAMEEIKRSQASAGYSLDRAGDRIMASTEGYVFSGEKGFPSYQALGRVPQAQ